MRIMIASLIVSTLVLAGPNAAHAQDVDAPTLYQRNCSQCHDAGINRAPQRDAFLSMTPERVLAALETGSMVTMANNRTAAERRAIAEFLTGKSLSVPLVTIPAAKAMCQGKPATFNTASGPQWNGWGHTGNTRYQQSAGLTAADVPRL